MAPALHLRCDSRNRCLRTPLGLIAVLLSLPTQALAVAVVPGRSAGPDAAAAGALPSRLAAAIVPLELQQLHRGGLPLVRREQLAEAQASLAPALGGGGRASPVTPAAAASPASVAGHAAVAPIAIATPAAAGAAHPVTLAAQQPPAVAAAPQPGAAPAAVAAAVPLLASVAPSVPVPSLTVVSAVAASGPAAQTTLASVTNSTSASVSAVANAAVAAGARTAVLALSGVQSTAAALSASQQDLNRPGVVHEKVSALKVYVSCLCVSALILALGLGTCLASQAKDELIVNTSKKVNVLRGGQPPLANTWLRPAVPRATAFSGGR